MSDTQIKKLTIRKNALANNETHIVSQTKNTVMTLVFSVPDVERVSCVQLSRGAKILSGSWSSYCAKECKVDYVRRISQRNFIYGIVDAKNDSYKTNCVFLSCDI